MIRFHNFPFASEVQKGYMIVQSHSVTSVVLKLERASECPEGLIQTQIDKSLIVFLILVRGPRICISSKCCLTGEPSELLSSRVLKRRWTHSSLNPVLLSQEFLSGTECRFCREQRTMGPC